MSLLSRFVCVPSPSSSKACVKKMRVHRLTLNNPPRLICVSKNCNRSTIARSYKLAVEVKPEGKGVKDEPEGKGMQPENSVERLLFDISTFYLVFWLAKISTKTKSGLPWLQAFLHITVLKVVLLLESSRKSNDTELVASYIVSNSKNWAVNFAAYTLYAIDNLLTRLLSLYLFLSVSLLAILGKKMSEKYPLYAFSLSVIWSTLVALMIHNGTLCCLKGLKNGINNSDGENKGLSSSAQSISSVGDQSTPMPDVSTQKSPDHFHNIDLHGGEDGGICFACVLAEGMSNST